MKLWATCGVWVDRMGQAAKKLGVAKANTAGSHRQRGTPARYSAPKSKRDVKVVNGWEGKTSKPGRALVRPVKVKRRHEPWPFPDLNYRLASGCAVAYPRSRTEAINTRNATTIEVQAAGSTMYNGHPKERRCK